TPEQLEIHDERSALSSGLRGLVTPSTLGARAWGRPSASATGLDGRPVTFAGDASRATVFGYEQGASMTGLAAPARRVGFFADEAAVRSFSADGWALFDGAIDWAAGPG